MVNALPNPAFEGSEKRLEIDFSPSLLGGAASRGLRALSRDQLDELMDLARCTIVSQRSNNHLDAYVLSESSLFVYPTKWVLKTCGTTRLLHSLPRLLDMAASLGLAPRRCKFTRASFLFPEQQLYPHCSPKNEFDYLQKYFGHLQPGGGQAVIVGELSDGLQWHVYTSEAPGTANDTLPPICNLEICMTELGLDAARQFYRDGGFVDAAATTLGTGIAQLQPGAIIDDYVFEPCGYSMNGVQDSSLMTIHVTPEPGHSYASLEMSGYAGDIPDPSNALAAALRIFRPGRVSLALAMDKLPKCEQNESAGWGLLSSLPGDYVCCSAELLDMPDGGRLAYYTFVDSPGAPALVSPPLCVAAATKEVFYAHHDIHFQYRGGKRKHKKPPGRFRGPDVRPLR